MDKAARETARITESLAERAFLRDWPSEKWPPNCSVRADHYREKSSDIVADLLALGIIDAADSDNARLQARVSELEAAVETATPLIGARNDVAHPAIKEANINEAWHVLNKVRLPAPPVGDR